LSEHIIDKYAGKAGIERKTISKATMDKLIKYSYPGNIRELENIIRNALVLSMGSIIEPEDIPVFNPEDYGTESSFTLPDKPIDIAEYIDSIERKIIINALEKNNWSRIKTAEFLNITERVLRYKINKFDIKKDTV
jgi:DNA-binding NtrC family response regulator